VKKALLLLSAALLLGVAVVYLAFPAVLLHLAMRYERGLAGLDEKGLELGGGRMSYLEGGTGAPVLLVHGFAADKDNWTRFARHVPEGFRMVAPDLPGFGESTRDPAKRYDILSQVERLRAFAQTTGLGRVHVLGNSMGGQIAAVYAALYPEAVASLTLLAPGGLRTARPSEMAKALAEGRNPLVVESPADFHRLMSFVFVEPPSVPGPVLRHFAERAALSRAFNDKVWNDLMSPPDPLEPYLGRIQARTLVIWGDSDRVLDVSGAEVVRSGLPSAEVVILKDCGHAPMIERPEESAAHWLRFVQALGEGV
jgi:abhydrolase domain-containing protein 6